MNKCQLCEGKGTYAAANGPDDFEKVICSCEAGKSYEFFLSDFAGWWKEQVKSLANKMSV